MNLNGGNLQIAEDVTIKPGQQLCKLNRTSYYLKQEFKYTFTT